MGKHSAKLINSAGDWELFYKPWNGTTARKVLRNKKLNLDITNEGDCYKIYSSFQIKEFVLAKKSGSEHEPRPYYYFVELDELKRRFSDIDESLFRKFDSNSYNMDELGI